MQWIKNMLENIETCKTPPTTKEAIEQQHEMTRKQEGQSLVHGTLGAGEKVIGTMHPSGKDALTMEMQDKMGPLGAPAVRIKGRPVRAPSVCRDERSCYSSTCKELPVCTKTNGAVTVRPLTDVDL